MAQIRLMIIEDNKLLREGIRMMLTVRTDIHVVGAFGDKIKILEKISETKPDVLLLDMGLAHRNSLKLAAELGKNFPELKVIAMSLLPVQAEIQQFIKEGIAGFILKDAAVEDLLKTILAVARGEKRFPLVATASLVSEIVHEAVNEAELAESLRMTDDEKKVLRLISRGVSDIDISKQLGFTYTIVKSLEDNILEKMSLSTRAQQSPYRVQKDTESQSKILKK